MNGAQQVQQMEKAGFSTDEIQQWSGAQRQRLTSAGFGESEVAAWFGEREPDMKPIRELVRANLMAGGATDEGATAAGAMAEAGANEAVRVSSAAVQPAPTERPGSGTPEPSPVTKMGVKPVRTFDDALSAGLQMSVTGLAVRGGVPNKVLAEDAPMAARIAASVGQMAGDLPAMIVGGIIGGGAGVETGPGAAITAGAGAFGLPAGLRATLMDAYTKGDFKSFGDFWERSAGIIWETVKGEITGAATVVSGGAATAATVAAAPAIRLLAPTAAEIATMTTVGRALEGQVPKADDFMDAAIVLGGFKVAVKAPALAAKLRDVYAKTGITPQEVVTAAGKDPTIIQDLAAENREVPASLGAAAADNAKVMPDGSIVSDAGGGGVPAAPARPASSPEPSRSQQAVLDRLSVGEGEKRAYTADQLYTDMKDELYPIRVMVDELRGGESLTASKDAYKLARETRGVAGKAQQFLEISPYKFDSYENVGKSLKAIVEPFKDDLDGLRAYAVAKRALELEKRGIETGVPLGEARDVVESGGKYAAAHAELLAYQQHLVDYLVDAGVVSKEGAATMREANRDYVPFFRLMDDGAGGKGGAGPGFSVRSPIKAIKGSERKIIDPLESIIKNTYLYTQLAENNAVARALIDLGEKTGRDDLVKKVAAPAKPIEVQAKEVQDFLDAHGIEGDAEAFSIFRRGFMNPAEDQIVHYRDGKREIYEIPKDVAAAFKGLDRESAGFVTKILAIPAKTLRAGATLAPDFMVRNMSRDQLSAAIFSDNNYVPVLDFARGMMGIAKKDREFQLWLKSGGANATLLSMDRQYLQEEVWKLADISAVQQKVWNVVHAPWMEKPRAAAEVGAQVVDTVLTPLKIASELIENATRLGEFKKGLRGATSKEAAQEAAFGSREVTLDFARIGAKTRGVNMITAFWNAQVEGVDREMRAFKDHPMRTSVKMLTYITAPSLLLWWANHDDPRWKEIPNWERDMFWIVMTKDNIYRIPKPFGLGILFGSVPERLLDAFMDQKPDAMKQLSDSLTKAFLPGIIPTVAQPILEHATNHSFFTDRPLIPSNLEKLLPEYQYTPYTTEATKALGQMIGTMPGMHDKSAASPMVIDNYVRGWTGTLGTYAVQVADAALRKAGVLPDPILPASTLADMPVVKAFVVRYPSAQAQSIQDFGEHYKESKMVVDTITYLAKQGDAEAAMREARLDPMAMFKLDGIHEALGNAQRVVQLIYKNPNFSADEKRQLIDATYMQMIEMAREGESSLRQLKKELGPRFGKEAKQAAPALAAATP